MTPAEQDNALAEFEAADRPADRQLRRTFSAFIVNAQRDRDREMLRRHLNDLWRFQGVPR